MGDRVILHSDINCCYASIEHLHHPELAGKPLAVGGDPEARHGKLDLQQKDLCKKMHNISPTYDILKICWQKGEVHHAEGNKSEI